MGVIRRGNSRYWYIQFQLYGKTYIKSSKTTDKRLAELSEAEWRSELVRNRIFHMPDRIELVRAFDDYCTSKQEQSNYRNLLRHCKALKLALRAHTYLDEIASADLEAIRLNELCAGKAGQTVKHRMNFIRGACKYAERLGNRVSTLVYPKIVVANGRLRYLSFEEEQRLLGAVDPTRHVKGLPPFDERLPRIRREMQDLSDMIVCLLDTGARYSEIATLRWPMIDMNNRTISLWRSKVKNESVLYMTDRLFEVLTRRFKERINEYVFLNRSDKARQYNSNSLRKAFDRAGLSDCSAHTLRHTHASRLVQNGLNLYEVKELLGHSDIRTTMRYAHIERQSITHRAMEVINRLNTSSNVPR